MSFPQKQFMRAKAVWNRLLPEKRIFEKDPACPDHDGGA